MSDSDGLAAWKAHFGHRALGWLLIAGGVGYVLLPYVAVLVPNAGASVAALPLAATIGEVWMIVLLLWTGLRSAQQ